RHRRPDVLGRQRREFISLPCRGDKRGGYLLVRLAVARERRRAPVRPGQRRAVSISGRAGRGNLSGTNYALQRFKLKATGAAYGYGYNLYLSAPLDQPPINTGRIARPTETAVLADAAQGNTW